jgi:tetratricopeptide (TPR) repeat protein
MPLDQALPELDELMKVSAAGLSDEEAMVYVAQLVDVSEDRRSPAGLDRADRVLDDLATRPLAPARQARIHYMRANVWSARYAFSGACSTWTWKHPALDGRLLELRRCISHPGFFGLEPVLRAQAHTNLGDVLNHVGRFVEAIEAWDRALSIVPKFAMAHGNRGISLSFYANSLYDRSHGGVLAAAAILGLAEACAPDAFLDSHGLEPALAAFAEHRVGLESMISVEAVEKSVDFDGPSLGRGKAERAYRRWALNNRLFLNPLNDVAPFAIAGRDILTLPSLTVATERGPGPPEAIAYYNILKQEFISARFAFYEGHTSQGVHYSDREVLLYDTLDFAQHGHAVERLKTAFRNAYSVFDKSAFLLNRYLGLGHGDRQVSFRNLWFRTPKARELHPDLDGRENWPLRGLYWLSKDIFEDAFKTANTPDARDVYELRNHLEHKFVTVHDAFGRAVSPFSMAPAAGTFDLSFDDLAAKSYRMLKLARASLIYLSLGVYAEERRREARRAKGGVGTMPLYPVSDRAKRRD